MTKMHQLVFWNMVKFVGFSVVHVSQGSVATYVRRGEMATYCCVANFQLSLLVKEFLKSVKIWQSNCPKFGGFLYFGTQCIYTSASFTNNAVTYLIQTKTTNKCPISTKDQLVRGKYLQIPSLNFTDYELTGCSFVLMNVLRLVIGFGFEMAAVKKRDQNESLKIGVPENECETFITQTSVVYTVIHKIGTPLYFCNNFFQMLIDLNENYTTVFVRKFAFRRCGLRLHIL